MAITAARIEDGSRTMVLMPRADIRLQELDVPYPAMREDVEDATDDDGTDDSTQVHGARAAAVQLMVLSNPRAVEDELGRFMHPRTRPYLVVTDDEWLAPRRLQLRTDQVGMPIGVDLAPSQRKVQAQWKVPSGIWEAASETQVTVAADVSPTVGRTYPKTYPWSYPATLSSGATIVTSDGSTPSHFTARLYGPCSAPRLINGATGEQIAFTTGLTLAAGEYVEIDTRDRTAFLLSQPQASRLGLIDFEATSWWRIEPGDQPVRYVPASAQAGAAAVITYRAAWL